MVVGDQTRNKLLATQINIYEFQCHICSYP